jgi:transcription elongation factor GreA
MADRVSFLTAEGRDKLLKELEYLRTKRRFEVAQHLKSAVEGGDLSENAGYEESKREQAFVEGRIRDIEGILGHAQLLNDSAHGNHEKVDVGMRVTVVEQGGADRETYQIVGRAEADPKRGRISNESPLGKALLGCRIGDTVQVSTPGGLVHFEVITIE